MEHLSLSFASKVLYFKILCEICTQDKQNMTTIVHTDFFYTDWDFQYCVSPTIMCYQHIRLVDCLSGCVVMQGVDPSYL